MMLRYIHSLINVQLKMLLWKNNKAMMNKYFGTGFLLLTRFSSQHEKLTLTVSTEAGTAKIVRGMYAIALHKPKCY